MLLRVKRPSVRRRLALSVCSVFLFFALAELVARRKVDLAERNAESCFEYDRRKVFRLKSDHAGSLDIAFRTNSHGMKDDPVRPKGHRFRILLLGDSVTFGDGIPHPFLFATVMERLCPGLDVLNTACPGNGLWQEYWDLRRGLRFKPDLILLQFTTNDLEDQWFCRRHDGIGTDFHGVPDVPFYHFWLSQRSALYLLLRRAAGRLLAKMVGEKKVHKTFCKEVLPQLRREYVEVLTRLFKKAGKIPVVIAVFPRNGDTEEYDPHALFEPFAEKARVLYVWEELRGDYRWQALFRDADHLNARGHQVVAQWLLMHLEQEIGLVNPAAPGS